MVRYGEIWVIRFQTTILLLHASARSALPWNPHIPNCCFSIILNSHYPHQNCQIVWSIMNIYEAHLWSFDRFMVHFVIHFRYVSICFNSLWVFDDLCMSSSAMSDVRFSGAGTAQPISVHRWSSLLWRLFACFLSKCMKYATPGSGLKMYDMLVKTETSWNVVMHGIPFCCFVCSFRICRLEILEFAMNFIHIWGNLGSETFRNRYPEASRSNGSLLPRNTRDKPRCYKCTTTKGIAGPTICLGHALWYTSGETDSAVVAS